LSTGAVYPDKFREYHGLKIKPDDLYGNVERALRFNSDYEMELLSLDDRPPEPSIWNPHVERINTSPMRRATPD